MVKTNSEKHIEVEVAGMIALQKALGPVDTIRFLQGVGKCSGNYTKEK